MGFSLGVARRFPEGDGLVGKAAVAERHDELKAVLAIAQSDDDGYCAKDLGEESAFGPPSWRSVIIKPCGCPHSYFPEQTHQFYPFPGSQYSHGFLHVHRVLLEGALD